MSNPPPQQFNLLAKCINGGIAGLMGVTCVFPLDLVKTRLQNQQLGPNGEKMYSSIFDCFKKTVKAEGFFGMYRGSGVNLLLITPEKAIKLAANDFFRYQFTRSDGSLPVSLQGLAGGCAGAFQIVVTTPMELLKIQMQDAGRIATQARLRGDPVPKVSATEIAGNLLKEKGIFGLYRGLSATALRDITFSILYFPLFAFLNSMGPRKADGSGEAVFWCSLLAGLGSGSVTALTVTPLDVVKTRLQAIKKAEGEKQFSGIIDCFMKTLKYEGVVALFKGGLCRMLVIAPLFGIVQMVYYLGVAEALLGIKRG